MKYAACQNERCEIYERVWVMKYGVKAICARCGSTAQIIEVRDPDLKEK